MPNMSNKASCNNVIIIKLVEIPIPFSNCFSSIATKSKFDNGNFYKRLAHFSENKYINYLLLDPIYKKKSSQ